MSTRFHHYEVFIDDNMVSPLFISAKMRFRAFKPYILNEFNPSLMINVPIYDMHNISKQINIVAQ